MEVWQREYTHHCVYGPARPGTCGVQDGVVFLRSTRQSRDVRGDLKPVYWQYYEVFVVPRIRASQVLGNCLKGHSLGTLKEYDDECRRYWSLKQYVMAKLHPFGEFCWYEAFARYSLTQYTPCLDWKAVVLYVQQPDMAGTTEYHVSVLRDCNEPDDWYRATQVSHRGLLDAQTGNFL